MLTGAGSMQGAAPHFAGVCTLERPPPAPVADDESSTALSSRASNGGLKVEVSRESFETKGDSAKTLNLYSKMPGEASGKGGNYPSPVKSPFAV